MLNDKIFRQSKTERTEFTHLLQIVGRSIKIPIELFFYGFHEQKVFVFNLLYKGFLATII